jgi:hypothetical protein
VANAEEAARRFSALVDDPATGFVPFVRGGYRADAISDEQLRTFAIRYFEARLASDSQINIDKVTERIMGETAGFVPSVEARRHFWLAVRHSQSAIV